MAADSKKSKFTVDLSDITPSLTRVTSDPFKKLMPYSIYVSTVDAENNSEPEGRLEYPASMVEPTPMPNPVQLAKKIEQLLTSNIMQFAASYIGEQVGDLLSPPSLADITGMSAEKMKEKLITPGDAIKILTKAQESNEESDTQEGITKTMNSMSKDTNKTVSETKERVEGVINSVKEWAGNIQNFIAKGPNWVEAQVDNINNNAVKTIQEQVSKSFQGAKEKKQKMIDGLAEKMAVSKATKINETVMAAAYEQLKQPQQMIAQAKTQAVAVAKNALLDMMATLGL